MLRRMFGQGQAQGQEQGQGQSQPDPAVPTTIGDIFYEAAMDAAHRTQQGAQVPVPPGVGPGPAEGLGTDLFLGEGQHEGGFQQPARQIGQPHMPGQGGYQAPQTHGQPGQAQGPAVFIPQGYQTPAQLRAQYDHKKAERAKLSARLMAAGETDPAKNPYARTGANGQVEFDQVRHNRDNLTFSNLDNEMRELQFKITEAEKSSGEVVEQVRSAANRYFQQQFAGRNASPELMKATGAIFARHVSQLIKSGFLLDAGNLSAANLNAHFQNVFFAAFGEASAGSGGAGLGAGPGAAGGTRPAGSLDSDSQQRQGQADPYDGWPEESKRMMQAFERSQTRQPTTLAEAARMEKERQQQGQQHGQQQGQFPGSNR